MRMARRTTLNPNRPRSADRSKPKDLINRLHLPFQIGVIPKPAKTLSFYARFNGQTFLLRSVEARRGVHEIACEIPYQLMYKALVLYAVDGFFS